MSEMDAENVTFYDKYKNAGVSSELVVAVGIRALLSIAGICMNLSLIYVTIRSKSLRNVCNTLIALETASVSLFLPINIVGFGVVVSGTNFVSASLCCRVIEPLPQLGLNFFVPTMLFIGIDRFLSVFKPIWHVHRKKSKYVFFIATICLCYTLFMLQLVLRVGQPESPVMCSLASDCQQNGVANIHTTNVLVINAVTVAFYVGIWLTIRYRAKHSSGAANQNSIAFTKRMFKPLAVIVSLYMFSYVLNAIIRIFVAPALRLNPVQQMFMASYMTAMSILSMIANAPILYMISTDYRKAYNKTFGWN